MTRAELEAQNETNLLGIMSNSCVSDDLRLFAAVLLYKRGSRFLSFQEFQPYKSNVLDYILDEQSNAPPKPFAPNVSADMAGRLHKRLVDTDSGLSAAHTGISKTDDRISQVRQNILVSLAKHDQDLADRAEEIEAAKANTNQIEIYLRNRIQNLDEYSVKLDNCLVDLTKRFESYKKTVLYSGVSLFVLSILFPQLIRYFLR
jgi:hypothetical protein